MTKKRSKFLFALFSILLVILLVATFVSFTYPLSINGNYYEYSSFVSNLKLGEDISKSLRIVYRTELPENSGNSEYNKMKQSTMAGLKEIVQSEGYKDVTLTDYMDGDHVNIVMQIGNILAYPEKNSLIEFIGSPATLSFYMQQKADGVEPFADAKGVKSVKAREINQSTGSGSRFYVEILFNDDLKDDVAEATSNGGTIYFYFGDEQFTGLDLGTSAITEGAIYIQSDSFVDLYSAQTYANKIKTGMLDLQLTKLDSAYISPTYGVGADVLILIAMLIILLAGFVYLIVKYRQLGWLASFNLLFFITLSLFLLQSIPLVHINFSGILGMIVCYLVAIDSLVTIFEKGKKYYNQDTKLYVAMKVAQNESAIKICIYNLLLTILGAICLFMPSMAVQSFGWVLFVMPLVNLFTSLALMRLFIKMYMPLNNLDGKKCNFHKGGNNV